MIKEELMKNNTNEQTQTIDINDERTFYNPKYFEKIESKNSN